MSANAQDRTGAPLSPGLADLAGAATPEAAAYVAAAIAEFNAKQETLSITWLTGYERWDIDMRRGVLVLAGGPRNIVFDVHFVGSTRESDTSWEWGWNNPGVPNKLAEATRNLPALGKRLGLRDLQNGMLELRDARLPWLLSALALKETGALGVFRGDGHGQFFYFLLTNPRETRR